MGKTTTAVNVAACLADAGAATLVVDLDPQANATSGLGERANGTSTYDLLDGAPLKELAQRPECPTSISSPRALSSRAPPWSWLGARTARRSPDALAPARGRYDFVFIDCPPSLGPLTVNALAATDRVLVPVQCEYALEGLAQLLHSIELVRTRLNPARAGRDDPDHGRRAHALGRRRGRGSCAGAATWSSGGRAPQRSSCRRSATAFPSPSTTGLGGRRCLLPGSERACRPRLAPSPPRARTRPRGAHGRRGRDFGARYRFPSARFA